MHQLTPLSPARLWLESGSRGRIIADIVDFPALSDRSSPVVRALAQTLLDEGRLLELGDALGRERLDGLLGLLGDECHARPARLRAHLANGDFPGLRAEAHSLRGAALSVGALALAEVSLSIEQTKNLAAAGALIDRLDRISSQTSRATAKQRAGLLGIVATA